MLAIVTQFDLKLEQFDVKNFFKYGSPDEIIYMTQPKEFEMKKEKELSVSLEKSLYGLKQARRQWYKIFNYFVQSIKFKKSEYDPCFISKEIKNLNSSISSYMLITCY